MKDPDVATSMFLRTRPGYADTTRKSGRIARIVYMALVLEPYVNLRLENLVVREVATSTRQRRAMWDSFCRRRTSVGVSRNYQIRGQQTHG